MEFSSYLALGLIGGTLFFAGAAWALHWAARSGQFRNLEHGSRTIFDEEEPEGRATDRFPVRKPRPTRPS